MEQKPVYDVEKENNILVENDNQRNKVKKTIDHFSKVDQESAEKEFNRWLLEVRRVEKDILVEKTPDMVQPYDSCVKMIQRGKFSIDWSDLDNIKFVHKLTFPIGEGITDNPVSELRYGPRLQTNAFDKSRKYQNPDEHVKTQLSMSALSGVNMSLITKLEEAEVLAFGDLMFFYLFI